MADLHYVSQVAGFYDQQENTTGTNFVSRFVEPKRARTNGS